MIENQLNILYENIKQKASSQGYSLAKLAVDAGITEQGLHQAIKKDSLRVVTLLKIAELLNTSLVILLSPKGTKLVAPPPIVSPPINNFPFTKDVPPSLTAPRLIPSLLPPKVPSTQVTNSSNFSEERKHLQEKVKLLESTIKDKNQIIEMLQDKVNNLKGGSGKI